MEGGGADLSVYLFGVEVVREPGEDKRSKIAGRFWSEGGLVDKMMKVMAFGGRCWGI